VINPDDTKQEKQDQEETGLTGLQFVDMDKNEEEGIETSQSEQQTPGLTDLKPDYGGQRYDVVLLTKLAGKNHNTGLQRYSYLETEFAYMSLFS